MQIIRTLEGESEGVDFGWVQPRECLGVKKIASAQRRKKAEALDAYFPYYPGLRCLYSVR